MSLLGLGPRFRFLAFPTLLTLIVACFLGGGASRIDVLSLPILYPLAVLCLAVFLLTASPIRWPIVRPPLLLIGSLAGIMAVQLIPLPPSVWTALPGHALFAQSDVVAGLAHPWRPISLTPDLTLASLVSLVVPLAVLVGFASVTVEQTQRLLPWLLGLVMLSALLGLLQLVGGGRELYFYEVTNRGSGVGFFANRNHQAVLLAMAWPMIAVWAFSASGSGQFDRKRWIALGAALFVLPMIMATGSRGGIILGAIGLAAGGALWWQQSQPKRGGRRGWIIPATTGVLGAVIVVAGIVSSRNEAVQRLTGMDPTEESRLQFIPTIWAMIRDFMPVGSGFGSFDPVHRAYEPTALLRPQYLNHAHNDLLEIILVGGLPAIIVVVGFLAWLTSQCWKLLRGKTDGQAAAFAQLGATMILLLLLSSLVDYPLRTPLFAALASIAAGWLSDRHTPVEGRSGRK